MLAISESGGERIIINYTASGYLIRLLCSQPAVHMHLVVGQTA